MNTNIINKILWKWIQQCKRVIHNDQVEFVSGMQGWFEILKSFNVIHHMSKLEMKNHTINRYRKHIWQNPTLILYRNSVK